MFMHAAAPKDLWEVEGAGHVDIHRYSQQKYEQRVLNFLEKYLNEN